MENYGVITCGMTPLAKADFEKALEAARGEACEGKEFGPLFSSALKMKQAGRMLTVQEKMREKKQAEGALELVAAVQLTSALRTLFGKNSLRSSEMEIEGLGIWLTEKQDWQSACLEILTKHARELSRRGNYERIRDEIMPACTELFGLRAFGNVDELTRIQHNAASNDIISLCSMCKAAARADPATALGLLNLAKKIYAENSPSRHLINPSIMQAEAALGWRKAIGGLMNWRTALRRPRQALTIREVQNTAKQGIETRP